MIKSAHGPATIHEKSAWILAAFTLFLVVKLSLLPALISGLLVFQLVHIITPYIARRFPSKRPSNYSKIWAVSILVAIIVSLLALAGASLVAFFTF